MNINTEISNNGNNNKTNENTGCWGCLTSLIGWFFVFCIIFGFFTTYDEEKHPEGYEKSQIESNITNNGISFNIVDKKYTDEFALRQAGIPSEGNSIVMVIGVDVQNNSLKPYKSTDIRGQLVDSRGAIYEGGMYRNILDFVNSNQNILNPGMHKVEYLFFKIPKQQAYRIELQDGTFFSDTVSFNL